MTAEEQKAYITISKWLPRIGRELARANKLEEFRLRAEYSSSEATRVIDRIMED